MRHIDKHIESGDYLLNFGSLRGDGAQSGNDWLAVAEALLCVANEIKSMRKQFFGTTNSSDPSYLRGGSPNDSIERGG